MNFKNYIVRDPNVLNGVPVIKGTQIKLETILDHFVLGESVEKIVETHPELTQEVLKCVISNLAALVLYGIIDKGDQRSTLNEAKNAVRGSELLSDEQVSALLSEVDLKRREK